MKKLLFATVLIPLYFMPISPIAVGTSSGATHSPVVSQILSSSESSLGSVKSISLIRELDDDWMATTND